MKVAAVQTSPVFGEVERNIDAALDLVPAGQDLAVLPELFASGYQFRGREELAVFAETLDGPSCTRLRAHAAATGTTLVAGLAERAGDHIYNSSVLVRPDGTTELYRKVHLFWDEKVLFKPGDLGFPVFAACGTTVGMMICFDWVFPEAARSLALAGAQVICHPSNLVLPFCPDAMITRSLENRVFSVTTNRVGAEERIAGKRLEFIGLSQICGPGGAYLERLGRDETGAATAELDLADASPRLTPRNDLWEDRRPDQYRA
ncbi:acyltransferase [bacterium]|nr:acyltransferase [bacterium]MBU1072561.1 acyltransferase [bacterium]MBU1675181.1 acyltransferase [bacterium]